MEDTWEVAREVGTMKAITEGLLRGLGKQEKTS